MGVWPPRSCVVLDAIRRTISYHFEDGFRFVHIYHDNYEEWHGREDGITQGRLSILGPSNKA